MKGVNKKNSSSEEQMKKYLSIFILWHILLGSNLLAQWGQSSGVNAPKVYGFVVLNNKYYSGTSTGIYYSENLKSWHKLNSNLERNMDVFAIAVLDSALIAGTPEGIFISNDYGANWTESNNGLTDTYVMSLGINNNMIFAGTTTGAFFSTDKGINWSKSNGISNTRVISFAFSKTEIFAGTWNGVYVSKNNGVDWIAVNNGLTHTLVKAIAIFDSNVFAGTSNGIYLTTNGGDSWDEINFDLSTKGILSLAVYDTNLFASISNIGVFLLDKTGKTWINCNSLFLFANIDIIGDYIFAGSLLAAGISYCPISSFITSVKELDNSPTSFNLSQNYPNPFNPTTTIKYSIPTDLRYEIQDVRLVVYDILGREVTTLVNQKQKPGNYEVVWDASDKSSGIYFYKLKTSRFMDAKRMIFLK